MKISVKRFFNNASESYQSSAEIQRIIASYLAKSVDTSRKYNNVLEIGTGTGFLTENLKNDLNSNLYINLDMAFDLLQSVHNGSIHHPNMTYINADAEFIPFKHKQVDMLLSSSTFQWLEQPESSIPEILKLLNKNAPFHFSIFGEGTFFEMKEISKITNFGSVMPLKNTYFYKKIFEQLNEFDFNIETKNYIVHYESVIQFLKHHKKTGARYTTANKPKGKKSFSAFCQLYKDIFGSEKGIPVTYTIHYINGVRSCI